MLQSYFIGALQNPSKTATIQWLIFDETPFLHQYLFYVFYPWMICHHKRHNFAFSLLVCFLGADCSPAKETSDNVLSISLLGNHVLQVVF